MLRFNKSESDGDEFMWFSIHRCVLGIVFNEVKKIISQYELFKNQLHLVNRVKSEVQTQTYGFAVKGVFQPLSLQCGPQSGRHLLSAEHVGTWPSRSLEVSPGKGSPVTLSIRATGCVMREKTRVN